MVSMNEYYTIMPRSFNAAHPLRGKVVYIHHLHRFVCLEFKFGDESFRECFAEKELNASK